jgi:putative spermidine/putrescine transport system substrate-binding protein
VVLVAAALALVAAACGSSAGGSTTSTTAGSSANGLPPAEGIVRVLGREGYTEDSWIVPFERQTGCRVVVRYLGPGDDTTALLAQGSYDLVTLASEDIPELARERVIRPLDVSLIPHFRSLRPALRAIPALNRGGTVLGEPFQWGPNLLIWNSRAITTPPISWNALLIRKNQGRGSIPDDPMEIADFALLAEHEHPSLKIRSPFQLSERQLRGALNQLKRLKARAPSRWEAASDQVGSFVNGAAEIGSGWSYVVRELRRQGIPSKAVVPLEGGTAWLDSWALVANAPHPGCAYRFLDYATKATVQAQTSRLVGAAPAAPGACTLLSTALCRSLGYVSESELRRLVFRTTPGMSCPGGQTCTSAKRWRAVWNRLWR